MPLLSRRRDPSGTSTAPPPVAVVAEGVVSVIAFATAFAAVIAAVIAWAGVMGVAPVGIPTVDVIPPAGDLGNGGSMAATGLDSVSCSPWSSRRQRSAGRVLRPRDA